MYVGWCGIGFGVNGAYRRICVDNLLVGLVRAKDVRRGLTSSGVLPPGAPPYLKVCTVLSYLGRNRDLIQGFKCQVINYLRYISEVTKFLISMTFEWFDF